MNKYHKDILTKKRKEASTTMEVKIIDHFYSKKVKRDLLPPSKADQTKGEVLLVKWVAESLRPFTVVEGEGFCDFVQFLCNLHRKFSVPGRIKMRNQLVLYGELVRMKMKEKILNDVKS
jgi:Hermes transposase DNA-binding domain